MTKPNKNSISGNFSFIIPSIFSGFVQGEDAKALYDEVRKTIKNGVWYDEDSKTMRGSSTFLAARVDSIVRPLGIRVATLADLGRPEILEMVKRKHYSDIPAIVFRSMEDDRGSNDILIRKLAPQVEKKMGRLQLPVLVTGFDIVPSEDKKGYELDIVPRKDFAVLHDERLSGKYAGKIFSTVDEKGLPNFDIHGNRIWLTANSGLSGLYLNEDQSLDSRYNDNLTDSREPGRIILVRDAAAEKAALSKFANSLEL